MPKRLILASASPRRRDLLCLLGLPFEVIASEVSEEIPEEMRVPFSIVERLALAKADDVTSRIYSQAILDQSALRGLDTCVIGCDTIVALEHLEPPAILGKPADSDDARTMLKRLSGGIHCVYTGVALVRQWWDPKAEEYELKRTVESVQTEVHFRSLSTEIIDWYISTGEPFDKAGAYGIQGHASVLVYSVDGDYFNVVGLPVATVARMLEDIGIEWWKGAAALE